MRQQVGTGTDPDDRLAGRLSSGNRLRRPIRVCLCRCGRIGNPEHKLCRLQRGKGAADADAFHFIRALTQSRRVRQPQCHAPQRHRLGQHVPRRAGNSGHDGGIPPHQPIVQRAFSRVGRPADGGRDAFRNGVPRPVCRQQAANAPLRLRDCRRQFRRSQLCQIFLREVNARLKIRQHRTQGAVNCLGLARQMPAHARAGQAQLLITARLQQVAQRLRFVQGQPTVQERPTRELARQSLPRTRPQAGIQHAARDQNAAVAGYFRHILPGKGVRCGEQGAQPVIQYTSRLVRRQDIPPDRHTGGVVGQRPAGARAEQPRSDRRRIRTGQPDDRNAALSKGRCHSGNRIKKSVGTHTSSQKEGRPPNGKSALLALLCVVVPVGNV